MSRRSTTRYAACLAMGLALALAGCSSATPTPGTTSAGITSPTKAASPSSTTSTSASPTSASASPTATVEIPAAARAETPEGAYAFTRHFIEQMNLAWTKPQPGLIGPLSTSTCKSCQGYEDLAAGYAKTRTHYDRTPIEIVEISSHGPRTPGPTQVVDVVAHQSPAKVVDANGKSVQEIKEQRGILVYYAQWISGAWRMSEVKVQQ